MRFSVARLLVSVGLAAVVALAVAVSASGRKNARYVGSEECTVCHADTHAAIIEAHRKTAHSMAMFDAAEKPDAIVAVFDDDSPVKKEDIRYILGPGRRYQNYLDKDLKLLPGKWDARAKKWVRIEPLDGATQCVGCHTTNFDPQKKTWTELGVGCESCHGPGGEHADSMDPADLVDLRKLDSRKRTMVCGQCHAFGTDPTGKFAFSVTYLPGDDLDEHFKLKEPGEHAENTQYNTFVVSKHAGAMTCTSCHDTHGDKTKAKPQLRRPINEQCLGCHRPTVKSMQAHAPNAGPDDTCATCHMLKGSHAFKEAAPR